MRMTGAELASMEDRVRTVLGRALGRRFDDDALVAGQLHEWDSLAHVKLIIALETEFDIQIPPDDIPALYRDFDALRDYLTRAIGEQ